MRPDPPRILIFIVSYYAAKRITAVIERIPGALLRSDDVHILCIDDASTDLSAETAARWVQERGYRNVTVLRNPINQGYGGNQKLGYRFAIDEGYDLVILLHGDGQYAPELLPRFVETWKQSDADVVLGSRMESVASARRGGMPIYKIVGNRILSAIQNTLTGRRLSEYHSGYRAFSTRFLRSVPFEINTNDFHFDTEILLQAFHARAHVVEFPIPTHYGDEVCHVSGFRYARDVLFSTLQYRLHAVGMLCSLKYQDVGPSIYQGAPDQRHTSHALAFELVKRCQPRRLLDLSCGAGFIADRCREIGASVVGVDKGPVAEPTRFEAFHRIDLERDPLPVDPREFDVVVMLDLLERLGRPEEFLLRVRHEGRASRPTGNEPWVVLATPNVAFIVVRLNLLLGRFNYSERGILNIAYKRLFTRGALKRMLRDCGYEIHVWSYAGPPFERVMSGRGGRWLSRVANALARLWPAAFAFQFVVLARPRPSVAQLLHQSEAYLVSERRTASLDR